MARETRELDAVEKTRGHEEEQTDNVHIWHRHIGRAAVAAAATSAVVFATCAITESMGVGWISGM
jgi:negative regulator of sigma E activity